MSEKQIIDLLHSIRYEVMDLKVRIASMEMHLKQQDQQALEVLAAARRVNFSLATAIDLVGEDELEPPRRRPVRFRTQQ